MDKRKKILLVAGAVAALSLGGGGLAYASGVVGDGQETVLTGPEADQAGQAAVSSVGGGTVGRVVQENEAGVVYDVEVTKPDGTTAEVQLDKDFKVVPGDGEGASPEGAETPGR